MRFEFEMADPGRLDSVLRIIKNIDAVYETIVSCPAMGSKLTDSQRGQHRSDASRHHRRQPARPGVLPPDGSEMENVHVGVQLRRDPAQFVRGGQAEARWEAISTSRSIARTVSSTFPRTGRQGRRGERFIYLTSGNVDATIRVRDVHDGPS